MFKTSMLQDMEGGKSLEIDGLLTGTLEIARKGGRRCALHREPARHDSRARSIHRAVRAMKKLICALSFAACSMPALGQYAGPGVETCRAYAERELRKENSKIQAVVFERDQNLNIDRYTRNVGSQFVSSLLYGNGAIVYAGTLAIEMSFLCLLADDKRAVFFNWSRGRDAPSLAQCRRGGGSAGECLDSLLTIAEQELTALYAKHAVEAREGGREGRQSERFDCASSAAIDSWRAYRDAECARRAAGDERKACMLDLTRRRALDLH
jgi:hypothetical protein